MKPRIPPYALAVLLFAVSFPAVNAEEFSVALDVSPTPPYGQVMAYESYVFNVTLENMGVTAVAGEALDETGELRYTGRVVVMVSLPIRGRGGYDFGESTTGYVTEVLEEDEFRAAVAMPANGTKTRIQFNYTFTKDGYLYGLKPYEDVEVTVKTEAYYEVYSRATGPAQPFVGPLLSESTVVYSLVDETKIAYVEGKLQDMADEVAPIQNITRSEYVDASRYLGMLDEMNASVRAGDYVSALKTYKRYDEKYRQSLLSGLTKEAALSRERAGVITDLEWQITQLESTLEQEVERLQIELDQAQTKYATLSQTYQSKQVELEEAKQSLSTAITAVFLASIAFFFLGRASATGKLFGWGRTHQEVNGDETGPGVRGDGP